MASQKTNAGRGEGDFTFVAVGDTMICRRWSQYTEESFLRMIENIRNADVAFMNLEGLIHEPKAYPLLQFSLGSYFNADPFVAEELRWAGFDMVSLANNHTMDYSPEALYTNQALLDQVGMVYSGAGRNLTEAREPAYIETAKGRIALLSVDSSFESGQRASEARGSLPARPGVNGLRFETYYVVDKPAFESLSRTYSLLRLRPGFGERPGGEGEISFLGKRFLLGEKPGLYTVANKSDVEDNIRWIKDARRQADYVLVSMHSHESSDDPEMPAQFIVEFSHACIDAGADAYLGHGDHQGKGIEIYKDKPIFYDLGGFVFQVETLSRLPSDAYEAWSLDSKATPADFADARMPLFKGKLPFRGVIASFTFKDRKLIELKLYPITLGYEKPRPWRGTPMLADETTAGEIIERVQRMSIPFGTQIEYKDGIGVARLEG